MFSSLQLHGPDVNILAKDLQIALKNVEEITTLCRQEDHFTDEANRRLSKQLQSVITELVSIVNFIDIYNFLFNHIFLFLQVKSVVSVKERFW